jgi:glycerophosphoryl diester phosphodiesterase
MGHAPENTLASIREAIAMGSPCIEIDVYFVDGHLVVFHDDRLDRTTNGTGYLCESTFDYLRSLDAGNGQKIPTLEEVCAEIDSKTCLNIELKGPDTAAPVADLITLLVEDGWDINRFLVSSFHHRELLEIRRLHRDINLGALVKGIPVDDAKFAEDLGAFSVHPSLELVDQHFVKDAHERGMKVYVYTVDNPEDLVRMQSIGVDGVFTGFPERVLEHFSQCDTSMGWC